MPGVTSLIHFTKVWTTNWAFLFDNFIDGLHAPYLHRLSPQFALRRLQSGRLTADPILTSSSTTARSSKPPMCAPRTPTDWSTRWIFPVWENFRTIIGGASVRPRPDQKEFLAQDRGWLVSPCAPLLCPHGAQVLYFTQFIIPIDRYHLYNMCALTGNFEGFESWRGGFIMRFFASPMTACLLARIIACFAMRPLDRNTSRPWIKT